MVPTSKHTRNIGWTDSNDQHMVVHMCSNGSKLPARGQNEDGEQGGGDQLVRNIHLQDRDCSHERREKVNESVNYTSSVKFLILSNVSTGYVQIQ